MTRYEFDGRNSNTSEPDFYDRFTEEFNNQSFVPMSRVLPDLHYQFAVSTKLPLTDYLMTPDKAKALITSMKPRIARIVADYEQSGNGDGMRRSDNDDNDDDIGGSDLTNCVGGDNCGAFLC